MTEYNFEKEECEMCHTIQFCLETITKHPTQSRWLCENCFGWSTNHHAKIKDEIRKMMIQQGIEDLDISV